MPKITREELEAALSHYTGTEQYFRHGLNHTVVYTDGVAFFAKAAGAYWMLDIFATELPGHCRRAEFLSIKMHVAERRARLLADDGKGKVLWQRKIDFTDCPAGEWSFFMAVGGPDATLVVMLPREY